MFRKATPLSETDSAVCFAGTRWLQRNIDRSLDIRQKYRYRNYYRSHASVDNWGVSRDFYWETHSSAH